MILLILEALGALALLLLIVWWTMFSGRDKGELPGNPAAPGEAAANTPSATEKILDQPGMQAPRVTHSGAASWPVQPQT